MTDISADQGNFQSPNPSIDLPSDKTEMAPGDTLAFAIDDNGTIVELLYSDENGVYVRDNGQWTLTDPNDTNAGVWDRQWQEIEPQDAARYDQLVQTNDHLTMNDFAKVITDK